MWRALCGVVFTCMSLAATAETCTRTNEPSASKVATVPMAHVVTVSRLGFYAGNETIVRVKATTGPVTVGEELNLVSVIPRGQTDPLEGFAPGSEWVIVLLSFVGSEQPRDQANRQVFSTGFCGLFKRWQVVQGRVAGMPVEEFLQGQSAVVLKDGGKP